MIGNMELLVLILVILVLFGAKRLPELAKSAGQGIREFKKELHDEASEKEETTK
jgi:sec-independent protein translocase protein TatA